MRIADLSTEPPANPGTALRIHNLYAAEDGESHWRDLYVPFDAGLGTLLDATAVSFRVGTPSHDLDLHTAPVRQLMTILAGGTLKVTASDGEARTLHPGEVLFVEDVTGKGHVSQAMDGLARLQMFVRMA